MSFPTYQAGIALFAIFASSAHADQYFLSKPADAMSQNDFWVFAQMLDMNFERFDFRIDKDFCLRTWLEVTREGDVDTQQQGGHCSRAGDHRLIVVWRLDGSSIDVKTALHHADNTRGITGSAPIPVPSADHHSARDLWIDDDGTRSPPALAEGKRTRIADFAYGGRINQTRIRVFAELLPNTQGVISSGALP